MKSLKIFLGRIFVNKIIEDEIFEYNILEDKIFENEIFENKIFENKSLKMRWQLVPHLIILIKRAQYQRHLSPAPITKMIFYILYFIFLYFKSS